VRIGLYLPPVQQCHTYLLTYLLLNGYPGIRLATWSGTRVTNYPITAAIQTTRVRHDVNTGLNKIPFISTKWPYK